MDNQEIKSLILGDKLLPIVRSTLNNINFKLVAYMIFRGTSVPELGYSMLSVECFKDNNEGSWGVYTVRAKDVKPEKVDPDSYDIFTCK